MPLLYVDVLGVKARWRSGGPDLVVATYARFEQLLQDVLVSVQEQPISGGIESDAVALVFDTTVGALRVGRALFAAAFQYSADNAGDPLWLRGVVSPSEKEEALVVETPFQHDNVLTTRHFSRGLLRAINIEQSGTKGMRLLLDHELYADDVIDHLAIPIQSGRHLIAAKTLANSIYPRVPSASEAGYADVFWMVPDPLTHWDQWRRQEIRLSRALRAAGRNSDEFAQLSATALVFNEVAAILGSISLRRKAVSLCSRRS